MSDSTPFTPGPWRYVSGTLKHYVESECGDLRFGLQEMHWRDGRPLPAEANARLIAKAPEMFELLSDFVDQVDRQIECGYELTEYQRELWMRAQAAVSEVRSE